MRSAMLMPAGGIYMTVRETPVPGPGEALIRVLVCGVCTSDMSVYKNGMGSDAQLGHEVVGIVESLGEGCDPVWLGKRVTGAIMQGYADFTTARTCDLLEVPSDLTDQEAITEPFSCMISGIRRAACQGAARALIVGAGFMGLGLTCLLKAMGVKEVWVADVKQKARQNALDFAADKVFLPEEIPEPVPFVFEAGGSQGSLNVACENVQQYGTLIIVGYHPGVRQIDMSLWASRALAVINAFEYNRTIQLQNMQYALTLVKDRKLPLDRMFTHSFPLEQTDEAFQTHLHRPPQFIKGYVRISK